VAGSVAWGRAVGVLGAVLIVDQLTKRLVENSVSVGDERGVFPAVQLVHVRNRGVAFGAFAGGGTIVLVLIAAALLGLILYFATHTGRALLWLPTGLLVGGAIGNIFDRIRDGAVTDFIKLPLWPAFNFADMCITFGVLALLYVIEGQRDRDGA
jgi:signal peptidase II